MSIRAIATRSAPLYAVPDATTELETECLFGEAFDVVKSDSNFSYGKLLTDGYEGWVPSAALVDGMAATHRLSVPASWLRADANIKSQSLLPLSMGSMIKIDHQADNVSRALMPEQAQGYIPSSHLVAQDHLQSDWVSVAESFLGVPYLWGGRTHSGLDCSALVQLAAQSAQIALPRNSSQQQHEGTAVQHMDQLQRGDLVFWKGHVGVMQSDTQLLHANAHHMQVVSEPLQQAVDRIALTEGAVTAMQRLVR